MPEQNLDTWKSVKVGDLVEKHFCGPSPDCEERQVFQSDEWGVLKTTAITWFGWDEKAHKVLPKAYWNRSDIEVHSGDVLVTKAGPRHRVAVVCHVPSTRKQLVVSGKMIGLRPKFGIVKSSVLAGLIARQAPQKYIHDRTTGMAESQVNFANEVLLNTPLELPPLNEQRVLVEIFEQFDTAIHETEAIIAKLKAVKQGLLHDLLTRGIDSNGELRPRHTEAPHLYKDSPIGWMPNNWEIQRVKELSEVVTGSTPPSHAPESWGPGFPFITPGDITEDGATSYTERNVSDKGSRYVRILPGGSSLVVCIGSTIGKVGINAASACTNQQINAVIPNEGIDSNFLFYALKLNIGQLRRLAGLQAVPIVNKSSFESIYLPVPQKNEQIAISNRILALSKRLNNESLLVEKLIRQKNGLMDDLLTGRVRVAQLLTNATQQTGSD